MGGRQLKGGKSASQMLNKKESWKLGFVNLANYINWEPTRFFTGS